MKHILARLLAISMLTAGLPLHACCCSGAEPVASRSQATDSCPHCSAPEPVPSDQSSCPCADCPDQLATLPVEPTAMATSDGVGSWQFIAADRAWCGSTVGTDDSTHAPRADGSPPRSGPSIPILLGHLLL